MLTNARAKRMTVEGSGTAGELLVGISPSPDGPVAAREPLALQTNSDVRAIASAKRNCFPMACFQSQ
jgi:hypothetical protein